MDRPVRLYDLHPSPNNIQVRLALAFKTIPYELIPVDPKNREPLIKARQLPEPTTFDRDLRCPVSEPTRYNWPKDLKDGNRVLDAAARCRPKNPPCRKAVPPYWRRRF